MSQDRPNAEQAGPDPNEDATLGGYFETHDRPPAFEGSDGHPYTVSIEVEKTGDLRAPYSGYLVFPRWAETGVGIVGHVETGTLSEAPTEPDARAAIAHLTLYQVQTLLEGAIAASSAASDV
jgi:hypothetical protein